MARFLNRLLAVATLVVIPGVAYGQASIAGVVRDSSGAVLPGVTVEASSDALIEKVRTAVTDGTGQYRIVDLRAGTYDVTFTLQGFSTVRREGIQLTGDFTATVNAELRLGSLEETITVTGESPIVDVQSARRQATMESEVLRSLPIDRTWRSAAVLVPGIIVSGTEDVGGMSGPNSPIFTFRGGRDKEGRAQVDGLSVGASLGGSGVSGYISDVGTAEEVTVTTSGHLGEAEVSGPIVNVVPRVGGNTLSGIVFGGGANGAMQGDNYTDEHRAIGLREPAKLIKMWDMNASLGGPIIRDRLWYYGNARHQGNEQYVTNMYANLNAGNPDAWTYEPDYTQQARNDGIWTSLSLRLTLQATERNKFNLFWDEQSSCRPRKWGGSATTSPEATPLGYCDGPWRSQQATWTSPVTNRLLFEAAYGTVFLRWGTKERNNTRHLIRVQEQAGLIPGLTYRSQDWADGWIGTHTWRASTSYVTGAHNMKIGHQGAFYVNDQTRYTNDHRLRYRFNNGVPNQLTMIGIPPPLPEQVSHSRAAYTALYGQEQWTVGRLTLQGALRYDYAWSYFPAHQIGPERFIPEPLIFPRMSGVKGYHDVTPANGCRVRRVRECQHVGEDQPGQVPRGGEQQSELHRSKSGAAHVPGDHPVVERRRPGL